MVPNEHLVDAKNGLASVKTDDRCLRRIDPPDNHEVRPPYPIGKLGAWKVWI